MITHLLSGSVALSLLAAPPPEPSEPSEPTESATSTPIPPPAIAPEPTQRARRVSEAVAAKRLQIGGGVAFGLGFALELTGAIISTGCVAGQWCAAGASWAWGSSESPTRFTILSGGPSSTWVSARVLAIPMVSTGYGLTVRSAALRGRVDARAGTIADSQQMRLRGWALLGSGIGLYGLSRLLRLTFAFTGACQQAACVHGFDLTTLAAARTLMVTGSAGLAYRRAQLGSLALTPSYSPGDGFGLAVAGSF
jgi:hypothetical protein